MSRRLETAAATISLAASEGCTFGKNLFPHFDDIYDIAADGYGIITARQARGKGQVTASEYERLEREPA